MIIEPTHKRAAQAANSLKKYEYAFIRRSDGSYSYAIVACRSFRSKNGATAEEEECIMFVVDEKGSTKVVGQKHWGDVVRLTRGLTPTRPTVADTIEDLPNDVPVVDCVPPLPSVAFMTGVDAVDENSLISM